MPRSGRRHRTLDELTSLAGAMGIARSGPGRAGSWAEPLDDATAIPAGQRRGRLLRAYFERKAEAGFHCDAAMRAFVAEAAGRTFGEAVRHRHGIRAEMARPQEVGEQSEFNRFLRGRHAGHPTGPRAEAVTARQAHRALPRELRERAAGGDAVGG